MYDNITVKKQLPLPSEIKKLQTDWSTYLFQTKDLENCLLDYKISKNGYLYEHVIEREYIPYTDKEKKNKDHRPWNIWKEVIVKDEYDKRVKDYHGKLRFYTYDNLNDEQDYWVEFDAYFIYGKLDKIVLVEFKKETARTISNEIIQKEYDEKQKKPWGVFKRYARYLGWHWFWKKVSRLCYISSNACQTTHYFIIKHLLS
jgi:hypothetical protein